MNTKPSDATNNGPRQPAVWAVVIGVLTATIPTIILFQGVTFLFVVPLALGIVCIHLGVVALRAEGKRLRHVGWLAVILMLVAVGLPFGMISYHNQPGHSILMVIPEGYRGPVKLIIDKRHGVNVPLVNGTYTYHIPQDGTLRIQDDSPFRKWHTMTAVYTNGNPIPRDDERTQPPDTVFLHSLGSGTSSQEGRQEEYIKDFVGTKSEFQSYITTQ
jgi:hypothetical protein